eukprot:746885-Pyramimonas_sp.AAC.1
MEKEKLVTAMRNCTVTQEGILAKLVQMGALIHDRSVLGAVGPAAVQAAVQSAEPKGANGSEPESVSIEEIDDEEPAPPPLPQHSPDARGVQRRVV